MECHRANTKIDGFEILKMISFERRDFNRIDLPLLLEKGRSGVGDWI
jgi:hypothetical protein